MQRFYNLATGDNWETPNGKKSTKSDQCNKTSVLILFWVKAFSIPVNKSYSVIPLFRILHSVFYSIPFGNPQLCRQAFIFSHYQQWLFCHLACFQQGSHKVQIHMHMSKQGWRQTPSLSQSLWRYRTYTILLYLHASCTCCVVSSVESVGWVPSMAFSSSEICLNYQTSQTSIIRRLSCTNTKEDITAVWSVLAWPTLDCYSVV